MVLSVDFKVRHSDERGIYFNDTKRAIIYLPMHESLDDIYKTINHEVYHHCFSMWEEVLMDDEQEERLIFELSWAHQSLA